MRTDLVGPSTWRRRLYQLIIGIVAIGVGSTYLTKAVHIDDALYVSIAKHIVQKPFDPYGGKLNWQQDTEPTYKTSISPPGLNYYFALVILVFGESELALHLSMIPWLIILGLAVFELGERFAGNGLFPSLLVLLSPGVAVGMNLMLDVPMLASITASFVISLKGLESPTTSRRIQCIVLSGMLAAVGCLIKYPAAGIIPFLILLAIVKRKPDPIIALIFPIVALAGWQVWSGRLYGDSQVGQSLKFLTGFSGLASANKFLRPVTMCAIVAMTYPLWIAGLIGGKNRWLSSLIGISAGGLAVYLFQRTYGRIDRIELSYVFCAAVALGGFAYADLLIAASRRLFNESQRQADLLALAWVGIFTTMVTLFGPFVATRSFLPSEPMLAILLTRSLQGTMRGKVGLGMCLASTAILSASLGWYDYRWANVFPEVVNEVDSRLEDLKKDRVVYFAGHWGFQHYAMKKGWTSWESKWQKVPPNAILIIAKYCDAQFIDRAAQKQLGVLANHFPKASGMGDDWRINLYRRPGGPRFYGGDYGEVPWWFTKGPLEQIVICLPKSSESQPADSRVNAPQTPSSKTSNP